MPEPLKPNYIPIIIQTVVPCIFTLIGVYVGYLLGLKGEISRERRNRDNTNAELMRSLSQEIGSNRIKCQAISASREITSFLETGCWDRIRFSDALYNCITSRNNGGNIYQQIINVYMGIARINLMIGIHISAVDAFVRVGATGSTEMMNRTYSLLREEVTIFLPQLTNLETNLRDFLVREGFFSPPR